MVQDLTKVGPPVLDMAPFFENEAGHGVCERRSAVLTEMNKAAREWGTFQIINHGVDSVLLSEALQNAKDFFALPWEEKLKLKGDHSLIGFMHDGMGGSEQRWYKAGGSADIKQHLFFAMEGRPVSVYNAWPESPINFRSKTTELAAQVKNTADLLMAMFSQSVGLSKGALRSAFKETCDHYTFVRYPAAMTDDQVVSIPAHQDSNCFTLIAQLNQTDGFQALKDAESEWFTVLTNGKFKSALHRVVLHKKERMGLIYFCSPEVDEEIAPVPAEADEPPRFRGFKYGEFHQLRTAKNITVEHYAI